jgi:hypothetical protein
VTIPERVLSWLLERVTRVLQSPTTSIAAVLGECKSMLGLRRRFAVCFLDPAAQSSVGQGALVEVRNGVWS